MLEIFSVPRAGAMGAVSLALFTAALVSMPSLPTTGAGLPSAGPQTSVNRALKGDRLPVFSPMVWQREFELLPSASTQSPARAQPPTKIPAGCEPAFSPISAPRLATVFRRCIT